MNRPEGDDIKTCTDCGADNPLPSQSCWLCHGDLRKNAPPVVAAQAASRRPRFVPTAGFFAVLTLLVTLLLVLIGFGLGEMSLGFLPWYGIIVIPALIATTVRVGRRRMQALERDRPDVARHDATLANHLVESDSRDDRYVE